MSQRKIKGNTFMPHPEDSTKMYMIASNNGNYTSVDKKYIEELKKYTWSQDPNGYFRTNIRQDDGTQKSVGLHTFIVWLETGIKDDAIVGDHIDNIPAHNVAENIRPATRKQNACNKSVSKNSKSGIMGIQYDKRTKKYKANLWLDQPEGRGVGSSKNKTALQLAYNVLKRIYAKDDCKDYVTLSDIELKDIDIKAMVEAIDIITNFAANQAKHGRDNKEIAYILSQLNYRK